MQNTKRKTDKKIKEMKITGIRLRLICLLAAVVWISYGCGKDETAYFLEEAVKESAAQELTGMENADRSGPEGSTGDLAGAGAEGNAGDLAGMGLAESSGTQNAGSTSGEGTSGGDIGQTVGSTAEKEVCFVHICGAVEQPGVYGLAEGSRVFEAVELAGGLAEDACGEYLNQAQKITDGMKIYIPTKEQVQNDETDGSMAAAFGISEGKSAEGGAFSASENIGLVNINTADKAGLMTLPGIGESRADSIIAYRQENGGFAEIEDIMQVSGIKEGAYQKLKDKICVR